MKRPSTWLLPQEALHQQQRQQQQLSDVTAVPQMTGSCWSAAAAEHLTSVMEMPASVRRQIAAAVAVHLLGAAATAPAVACHTGSQLLSSRCSQSIYINSKSITSVRAAAMLHQTSLQLKQLIPTVMCTLEVQQQQQQLMTKPSNLQHSSKHIIKQVWYRQAALTALQSQVKMLPLLQSYLQHRSCSSWRQSLSVSSSKTCPC